MPRSWPLCAPRSKILRPIAHRAVAQQEALTLIRARNLIVRLRTAAVNVGARVGRALRTSASRFFFALLRQAVRGILPPGRARVLGPGSIRFLRGPLPHWGGGNGHELAYRMLYSPVPVRSS